MAEGRTKTESRRGIQITVPVIVPTDDEPSSLSVMAFEQDGDARLAIIYNGCELVWIDSVGFESLKNAGTEALATLEDMTDA